jgi:hypothetical protein
VASDEVDGGADVSATGRLDSAGAWTQEQAGEWRATHQPVPS